MKDTWVINDQITSLEKGNVGYLTAQILVEGGFIFPSLVVYTVVEGREVVCDKMMDDSTSVRSIARGCAEKSMICL